MVVVPADDTELTVAVQLAGCGYHGPELEQEPEPVEAAERGQPRYQYRCLSLMRVMQRHYLRARTACRIYN